MSHLVAAEQFGKRLRSAVAAHPNASALRRLTLWFPRPDDAANRLGAHWAGLARRRKRYHAELDTRRDAKLLPPPPESPIEYATLYTTWYMVGRQQVIDDDNAHYRLKAGVDWLVRNGYLIEDTPRRLVRMPPQHTRDPIPADAPPLASVRLVLDERRWP